jgi:hypothetical protein
MFHSARRVAGTLYYHDILPRLSRAIATINFGHDPKPDEHAITKENERVYKTIWDVPVDDSIKYSIEELLKELSNPVKSADKWSSILKAHELIIKKLEEEKKKQLDKQTKGMMVVGKAFRPPPTAILVAADAASDAGVGAGAAGGLSPMASFINPPLTYSPNITSHPYYSTETGTPDKLPSKHEITPYGATIYSDESDTEQPDYASRILFGTKTPVSSPPPPDFIKNKENQNPQLLSPGPSPAMKLVFGSP